MAMQDYTAIVLEQAFTKSHSVGLATADRENNAMANVAEQTRLSYLEAKAAGFDLASSILQERSAQQQPQVGVIPPAAAISKTS